MNRSSYAALLVALPLCMTAVSTTAVAATAPQYQLVDLGNTGYAGEGSQWASTSWGALTQQWTVLSTTCSLGGSNAVSLPEYPASGYAVGSSCLPGGGQHAVRWSFPTKSAPTFGLTDLGALPGALPDPGLGIQSEAVGFNQAGDTVGTSASAYTTNASTDGRSIAQHAFLWNNGVMSDLGAIAGNNYNSSAVAVDDSHEVVGTTQTISSVTGETLQRAFVYTNGTMYNLTFYTIGGPTALLSQALWIDCQGNIAAVGSPASLPGAIHSYLLIRQGTPRTCQY
jgi:probable HAF family extracellular repeat protein